MKRAIIHMVETDRQWLMKLLTEHIDISKFTHEQVQSYANILCDVGIAAVPAPLGVVENIGSCEPDPVIVRWDRTGATRDVEQRIKEAHRITDLLMSEKK